jgi:hypothetical protein
MTNAFGYYASAKGMVLVPNLSELSSAAAISLLESSGLGYLIGADVNTTNQALDNLVASQTPSSNTLVDYGSVVSFSLYNFVPAPPFFPFFPFFPSFQQNDCIDDDSGECRGLDYYVFQYSPSGLFTCPARLAFPNDPSCAPTTCNETYVEYDGTCPSLYRQFYSNCESVCL